jgi:2-octaprenyl-6-methoxyphenol hydroxylase
MRTAMQANAAVIGAGLAGHAAALALAHVGVEVALIGPAAPAGAMDRRTTALIGPSVHLLTNLGVWPDCAGAAAAIGTVRIADDRGGLIRAPEVLFTAAEIGLDSFGANLPNVALNAALDAAAARHPRIVRRVTTVTAIESTAAAVHLSLADGGSLEASLAIAADGRASKAPDAAGIAVDAWSYPQAAVVTSLVHSRPHGSTVNE